MTRDHERLVHAPFVHDAQAFGELEPSELGHVGAALGQPAAERVERAADVVVDVEHIEPTGTGDVAHQDAVSPLGTNSGHSLSAVPPSTRSASSADSRSQA